MAPTYRKVIFKCDKCGKKLSHKISFRSEKFFKLAKEAIRKKGCSFCKHKPLTDISGYVLAEFECRHCGKRKSVKLSVDSSDYQKGKQRMLNKGCPRCRSRKDWVHVSSTPFLD
ncbi:MAG: hypothetical protein HQ536_01200 [Parcubacteria group bacterium]|nr:hypothetical protein [Parcubacteria group bacterium]